MRLTLPLAWLAGILVLTLTPGDSRSLVGRTSAFFGGSDLTDAAGHVVLFGILTLLLHWACKAFWESRRALIVAAGCGLLVGTLTEVAQTGIPDRGFALLDLASNWLGVGFVVLGWWLHQKSTRHSRPSPGVR